MLPFFVLFCVRFHFHVYFHFYLEIVSRSPGSRSPSHFDFRRNSKGLEMEGILNNMCDVSEGSSLKGEKDALSYRWVL